MPSYAITGAARGLGHEFVKQLSANPANTVFGIVRNPDTATGLASLAGSNPNVHVVRGDVVSSEQLAAAAAVIANVTGGSLDVLIHNAASTDTATAMLDPSQLPSDVAALHEAFRPTLDTSIFGAILLTNNFLSLIRAGTEKKIIHISSGMADTELIRTSGISYAVPYAAAKAALNVVVAKYAVDLRSEDIKVLAMSPGWVDTYEGPGQFFPQVYTRPNIRPSIVYSTSLREGLLIC